MTSIRTVIHDRRIEVPAPDDFLDRTEVEIDLVPLGERPVSGRWIGTTRRKGPPIGWRGTIRWSR